MLKRRGRKMTVLSILACKILQMDNERNSLQMVIFGGIYLSE